MSDGLIHNVDKPVGTFFVEGRKRGSGRMQWLWESALSTLEGRIKPHNFEMWLRPINCTAIEGQRITLSAPSKWIRDWFQDNYQSIVLDALRTQTNQEFEIVFEVREEKN